MKNAKQQITAMEYHYYDFRLSDVAITLRGCGATAGGGGEVLIIEIPDSNNDAMTGESE